MANLDPCPKEQNRTERGVVYQAALPHVSGRDEQILGQVLLYQVVVMTKAKLKTVLDVLDQQSLLPAHLYHAIDNQRVLS